MRPGKESEMRNTKGRSVTMSMIALSGALSISACATMSHAPASPEPAYALVIDNRSDLEVVVYAMQSPSAPGMRLGNARSFGTTKITVPQGDLMSSNELVVRVHPIGQATSQRDWVSQRIRLDDNLNARLDVRANTLGDLSMSMLYTSLANDTRTMPLAYKGHR